MSTEKFRDVFCTFCAFIAPRLNIAPSDPDTQELLREAAALLTLYLTWGKNAFRVLADELLQGEPRGIKVVELAMELSLAAGYMGSGLDEAAEYALWIADELESLSSRRRVTLLDPTA